MYSFCGALCSAGGSGTPLPPARIDSKISILYHKTGGGERGIHRNFTENLQTVLVEEAIL
jgi:hypothetical protein